MRCIALYHVRFEDLGSFTAPIERAGYDVAYRHAGAAPLTDAEWADTDLVVVLGGPIGVGDAAAYPWLASELAGLTHRLALRRPTLGICLGAQLMAQALGGAIVRRAGEDGAPALEIGWSPLDLADDAGGAASDAGPFAPLRGVPVLHWHGDNIVLPDGVASCASTRFTPVQAYAVGRHALAVQFHPEFAPHTLEEWLTGHAVELSGARVALDRLRDDTARHGEGLVDAGRAVVENWLRRLDG